MRSVSAKILVWIAAAACLAACGSSASKAAKTTAAPKTVIQTVTAAPTTDVAPTDADTGAPTDAEPSDTAVPTVSGVVDPNRSGSDLTIDDFFQPDSDWQQSVDSVANQTGVQGIEGQLDCYSNPDLELRLNDKFHVLTFSTAQDNTSDSSDVTMVVSVLVNGRQVTAKQVKFNAIQKFVVNVTSANAVMIQFSETNDNCGSVDPVVFNATVT